MKMLKVTAVSALAISLLSGCMTPGPAISGSVTVVYDVGWIDVKVDREFFANRLEITFVDDRQFSNRRDAHKYIVERSPAVIKAVYCVEPTWRSPGHTGVYFDDGILARYLQYALDRRVRVQFPPTTYVRPGEGKCPNWRELARIELLERERRNDPRNLVGVSGVGLYERGQLFEKRGIADWENYKLALIDYQAGAKEVEDVRAYRALARMYSSGMGTVVNASEAKKWQDLATAAYRQANNACTAPQVTKALREEVEGIDDASANSSALLALATGSQVGRLVINRVFASNLINTKMPFRCVAEVTRVNFEFKWPQPEYVVRSDKDGNEYIVDNSIEVLGANVLNLIAQGAKLNISVGLKLESDGNILVTK